ncbi:MAG TPA: hypothetical protein PK189_10715, partial [bacterium]|nr:hypothetical protein [bacterium]
KEMIKFASNYKPNFIYFHNINPHGTNNFTPLIFDDKEVKGYLEEIISNNNYECDIIISHIFLNKIPSFLKDKNVFNHGIIYV